MQLRHSLMFIPPLAVLAFLALPWNWGCSSSNPAAPVTVTQGITFIATPPPNTLAGRDWTYATLGAGFSARYGHRAAVFNNQMWVIGGYAGGSTLFNDVWSTSDGANWNQTLADTGSPGPNQFSRRSYHWTYAYNNRLWVVGGFSSSLSRVNDVWSSSDGVNWTNVLADTGSPGSNQFSRRSSFQGLVYNNKLWVIGGYDGSNYLNDVWSSSDGVSWTQVLAYSASPGPNQFTGRSNSAGVVYNNALWVIGGNNAGGNLNDVWYSSDGITWNQALADTGSPGANQFSRRSAHTSIVYGGAVWVIGGASLNDVWYSVNGSSWTQMTAAAAFPPRTYHASLVFNNDMWVIAGSGSSGYNDVWHSPF